MLRIVSHILILSLSFIILAIAAGAQSIDSYSAGHMWGTTPAGVGVPGAVDSAIAHNQNAASAGAVNAAEAGALYNSGPGSSISITSVGSQNIVSNTVIGDSNRVDIGASQSSSNSGQVSNSGTVGN